MDIKASKRYQKRSLLVDTTKRYSLEDAVKILHPEMEAVNAAETVDPLG